MECLFVIYFDSINDGYNSNHPCDGFRDVPIKFELWRNIIGIMARLFYEKSNDFKYIELNKYEMLMKLFKTKTDLIEKYKLPIDVIGYIDEGIYRKRIFQDLEFFRQNY